MTLVVITLIFMALKVTHLEPPESTNWELLPKIASVWELSVHEKEVTMMVSSDKSEE